jgi:hypothetical protein
MKHKQLAPGILLYENVSEDLNKLNSLIMSKDLLWFPGLISSNRDPNEDTFNTSAKLHTEIRNCSSIALPYDKKEIIDLLSSMPNNKNYQKSIEVYDAIRPLFDKLELHYLNKFNINYMSWHSRLELLRYDPGHFFKNHIDSVPGINRTVSVVFYLNDDYVGGEIYFDQFDLKIKPSANSALVFPSNYVYSHSAEKVIDGSKIAIASFLS